MNYKIKIVMNKKLVKIVLEIVKAIVALLLGYFEGSSNVISNLF